MAALMMLPGASARADITVTLPDDVAEGAPVHYSIQGVAPSPSPPARTDGLLAASYQTNLGPCPADPADLPSFETNYIQGPVSAGFSPTIAVAPGPFSFQQAFVPRQADPGDSEAPDEAPAGRYYGCAWLVDNGTEKPLSATQVSFAIREPHFTISLTAPRGARVVNPSAGRVRLSTYTARVSAEVGGRRLDVLVEPRGVRTCPRNVFARVPGQGFEVYGGAPFNRPVRAGGPATYRFKLGVRKPGRFLVCAGIYDPDNPIRSIASSNGGSGDEEAAAHTWVTIHG
jgi:hypothetical protein